MSRIWETHTPDETFELGKCLGMKARAGQVYCLDGELGTGIVQQYDEGRLPMYHFDVYRIGDVEEMEEIGYEDCFYGEGVCLIEWSCLIRELLPRTAVRIVIEKDLEKGFDYRKISIENMPETE